MFPLKDSIEKSMVANAKQEGVRKCEVGLQKEQGGCLDTSLKNKDILPKKINALRSVYQPLPDGNAPKIDFIWAFVCQKICAFGVEFQVLKTASCFETNPQITIMFASNAHYT